MIETRTSSAQPTSGVIAALKQRVRAVLADRLVRNVGWYGLAEFANRFTRLITTIILARWLIPQDFGIAAVAITTFEIVRVLAQYGIGQAVVRAPEHELPALLATAQRASWIVCALSFAIQIGLGAIIAHVTGRPDVFWMIVCLAGVYLTLPFGQIHSHLIVRANRLHVLAGIAVVQVAADNLLTAAFALGGLGAWAVVLPKLITAPIWVIGMRRAQTWRRDTTAGYAPMAPLAWFATAVIGSELLVAARLNLDKVIVGAVLGIEALGIYYFVFNAGLGFSLSLTSSVAASIYPHLAELAHKPRELMARYDGLLGRAVLPCAAIFALQAALAFIYVPIVFGEKWAGFAHLVAILCASAISKPLYDGAAQLMRAVGHPRIELYGSATLTAFSLAALTIGLLTDLDHGIAALAVTTFLVQAVFALIVRRRMSVRLARPIINSPITRPVGVPS
jgi:O-antigen/teichoic acid export membrane protein